MNWEAADDGGHRWILVGVGAALAGGALVFAVAHRTPDATLAVRPDAVLATPSAATDDAPDAPTAEPIDVTVGDRRLLPGDADFSIIAADHQGWRVIDVASGAVTRWRMRGLGEQTLSRRLFVSGDDLVVNPGLGPAEVLRVAPDGRAVAVAQRRQLIHSIDTGNAVWVHDGLSGHTGGAASLVDPDGSIRARIELPSLAGAAVGVGDALVVTGDAGTSLVRASGAEPIWDRGVVAAADQRRVAHVVCDRTRECAIVVGTRDDPDQHRLLLAPGDVPGPYFGSGLGAFSPDGRWLAVPVFTQSSRGYVTIIDTRTGARVGRPEGSSQPFTSALAWAPDSSWLVFAAGEGVDAWRATSGGVIKLDTEPVQALATRDRAPTEVPSG